MTTIVEIERAEINPLNPPANNSYSFQEGFPIIQFNIPNQSKFLDGSSLRLNGVLRVQTNASTEATPVLVDNAGNKSLTANANSCLSSRVGVASTIEQITLSSASGNQSLETIRSYPRYLASTQSITHSQEDFDTNLQIESLTASRKLNGALGINNDVSFSLPLRTGLLSGGEPIPLGTNGIRGMMLELRLSPDAQVLSGFVDNTGATKNDSNTGNGFFYQLRDLTLSYNLMVPDSEGVQKMSVSSTGSLNYNSVTHLYSVINSSDNTQNYNLGTGQTLSVFHNFLPTSHLNNYLQDGHATPRLKNISGGTYSQEANIKRVSFLKGGVLSPIENEIDVEEASNQDRPMSELAINFIDSIKPFSKYNHSLISLNTERDLSTDVNNLTGEDPETYNGGFFQADQDEVFGIGVAEDKYRVGSDFKNTNYGLRIVSDLDGQSPNSVFTYVMAKNTLQYSPQGIQVMA